MPTGRLWTLGIEPRTFQLGDIYPNDELSCPPQELKNSNNPVLHGITDVKFTQFSHNSLLISSRFLSLILTREMWVFFPRENLLSKDSVSSGMVVMVGMRLSGMTTWVRLFCSSEEARRALVWGRAPSRFSPPGRLLWTEAEDPTALVWSLESLMASS